MVAYITYSLFSVIHHFRTIFKEFKFFTKAGVERGFTSPIDSFSFSQMKYLEIRGIIALMNCITLHWYLVASRFFGYLSWFQEFALKVYCIIVRIVSLPH